MRSFTVDERRARLARRHFLAERPEMSVADVTTALVGLHATDPATPYLSLWARIPGFQVGDLDSALYQRRSVLKHLAMRRTLWVLTAADLPVVILPKRPRAIESPATNAASWWPRRRKLASATTATDGWIRRARLCCGTSPNTVRLARRAYARHYRNWRGITIRPPASRGVAKPRWHQGF